MHSSTLRGLLVGLSLFSFLPAQGQERPAAPVDSTVLTAARSVHGIVEHDGRLLGLGGALRAEFGAAGVEFTPALGADAAHDMPLRLEARSVLRGAVTAFEFEAGAEVGRTATLVDFDRGHGVTERYVARPDGIEQSFLLQRRPAGAGDLVVRLAVATSLACEPVTAEQLRFAAGESGGVHIGAVVGIDAAGRRIGGRLRYDGANLDLVLPGDFVDAAAYPLEVDPIVSGVINTGGSFADTCRDVAYDVANAVYLVVYEMSTSSTNQDVWAQRVTHDGIRFGGAIPIAVNSHRSWYPAVANCNSVDKFFVTWADNGAGNWNIRGCSVDAATGATSAIIDVANTAANEVFADVGGDIYTQWSTPQGECICVWDDAALGIRSCVVHMQNNPPTVDTFQTLVFGPDPLRDMPTITKHGGDVGRWFVAYTHDPQFMSVIGVDWQGQVVGVPTTALYSPNDPVSHSDIDGDGDSFTLVFDRREPNQTQFWDTYAAHGRWNATTGAIQVTSYGPLTNQPGVNDWDCAISLMGSKYTVAWVTGSANGLLEFVNLELDSVQKCGAVQSYSEPGRVMQSPCITSRRSSGDLTSEAGILGNRRLDPITGQAVLDAHLFVTFGNNPITPIAAAPGCGTAGGTIATGGGNFALGNQAFAVTLSGTGPTALVGLFLANVGNPAAITSVCGASCAVLLPDLSAGVALNGAGGATFALPMPCDPAFSGLAVNAQWAVLASSGGGCALLPQLHFSGALQLVLGN